MERIPPKKCTHYQILLTDDLDYGGDKARPYISKTSSLESALSRKLTNAKQSNSQYGKQIVSVIWL